MPEIIELEFHSKDVSDFQMSRLVRASLRKYSVPSLNAQIHLLSQRNRRIAKAETDPPMPWAIEAKANRYQMDIVYPKSISLDGTPPRIPQFSGSSSTSSISGACSEISSCAAILLLIN